MADEAAFLRIIRTSSLVYMVQNFIPNDGDHRIILLGYEPKLAFKRTRKDDSSHLNNTSQGASAELIELTDYSDEVISDVVMAAQLVSREVAGVDVLFNKDTGAHVILEVNASPQLATGVFLPQKKKILNDYFAQLLLG